MIRPAGETSFERDAIPRRVFEVAAHNPMLHAVLKQWEHGRLTWEQAMTWAVVLLADQVERLNRHAVVDLFKHPDPVIITKENPNG